ncbi:MAG: MtnX-like HAD-IB family phosphatase [Melioribacteraceae bacterium]|nr:MtnX-like HAD-IB family phosphatase [Melioribacteraceae bacterium]
MIDSDNRNFKVFIDFDGTITTTDVGEQMFLKFSDREYNLKAIAEWEDGKMSSSELWNKMCKATHDFDRTEFEKFLETIEIDEAFHKFVGYCSEHGHELFIVSDGFDYYINRILAREGLSSIKTYSNKLSFDEEKKLLPSFPYTDSECHICANCKRNHVISESSDEEFSIYIGDGGSDKCPAQFVDFIFAKNTLLKFCEVNRITYFPYINFHNVIRKFEELRNKKRLKKRHQAFLKRRDVYLQG